MLDLYFISVILFFALIAIWLYKDRKNIEVKSYVLFMRRTKRFRIFIDNIAKASPIFWKAISTLAIVVCFYYMFEGISMLALNSYHIFIGDIAEPGLKLILPSPSAAGTSGPGYILVPFWFWLITIACILVPHELSHGIIARAEKIKLKSVGLMLLAIFPGAFVEPDDRQLKKAKLMTKLRVFAAGSGANFLVAVLILGLTSFIIWPMATQPGVELLYVNQSSPAEIAGLEANMILTGANGNTITTSYQEYLGGRGYLIDELGVPEPGDTIIFTSDQGTYNVELESINGNAYMGIIYKPIFTMDTEFLLGTLLPLLTMIWLFSFAVAIFNILPLYPLDGGLMVEAVAERFTKKKSKQIVKIISMIVFLIILYNFIGPSLL